MRRSTATRRRRAWAGIMTYFVASRAKPTGCLAGAAASSASTMPLLWERRVVVRRKTTVSKVSDSSNAARVNARASAESDGSNIGSFAATA